MHKFFRALIFGLFIFVWSCKKGPDLGLQIQPGEDVLNSQYIDSLTVLAQVQLIDSIRSDNLTNSRSLLGVYSDPVFGKTTASVAAQLVLSKLNLVFESGLVIDSVFLELSYANNFYGDSTSTFTVLVNELSTELFKDSSYFSTDRFTHAGNLLGSRTFSGLTLKDSIPSIQQVNGKDTLINTAPRLRIPIDTSFIRTKIISALASVYESNDAFKAYFKGLSIEVDTNMAISGEGGIAQFDLFNNNKSALNIYFHSPSDTGIYAFNLNATGVVVNQFSHQYSNYIIQQTQKDFAIDNPIAVQTTAGVQTAIKIPYLANLSDSIFIHKAELELFLEDGSTTSIEQVSRLALVRKDTSGIFLNLPDVALGDAYLGGNYNSIRNSYILNLTKYIQDVLNGERKNETLFILPLGAGSTANRSLLKSFANNSKLKLYYTIIK